MISYWDKLPYDIIELIYFFRDEIIKKERKEFISSLTEEEIYKEIIKRNSLYSNYLFKSSDISDYMDKNVPKCSQQIFNTKNDWMLKKEVENHLIKYNLFNQNIIATSSVFTFNDIESALSNLLNGWYDTHSDCEVYRKVNNFWKNLDLIEQQKYIIKKFSQIKMLFLKKYKNIDHYDSLYYLGVSTFDIIKRDLI